MNTELTGLLAEIHRLQEEVERRREALREQFIYTLEGDRVRFAAEVRHIQRRYRVGALRYIAQARPLNIVTAPVIYAMSVPLVFLDAGKTLYQHICFRAHGIARARHRDFIIIDRHQLGY